MLGTPDELLVGPIRWCGRHRHLFKAESGYPTTGIGHVVATARAMQDLRWAVPGVPDGIYVSDEEKLAAWVKISNMPAGMKAGSYASSTELRLDAEDVERLARERLTREHLPRLEMLFAAFASYPLPAQQALADMAHDLGMARLGKYDRLRAACATGSWRAAAQSCVRVSAKPARNTWAQALFLELA